MSEQLYFDVGVKRPTVDVPGLTVIEDWIDKVTETELLAAADASVWDTTFTRRVQHHGWRYDYGARTVPADMYLGPLPGWLHAVAARLYTEGWMPKPPDQVIVNDYQPGQGIGAHVDCLPCFGPVVVGLTLGSAVTMDFTSLLGARAEIWLPRCSIAVLSGDARNFWTHEIAKRATDRDPRGALVRRSRRVSLTFRTVQQPG